MKMIVVLLLVISGIAMASVSYNKRFIKEAKKKNVSVALTATPLTPSPTVTALPEITNPPTGQNLTDLQYPDSTRTGSSADATYYESQDDPDVITNWYKEKIRNLGMNSKSFVQTKTNGNVLNKLAGARDNREVNVEIIKKSGDLKVKITVTDTMPIDNKKTI